ncbi:MAG: hypothetical protein WBQ11_22900, partial [Isosphaeraceae bacterium]
MPSSPSASTGTTRRSGPSPSRPQYSRSWATKASGHIWLDGVPERLKTLDELGYTGPVGLQCFGIGGDAREHLARSMAAWRKMRQT